MAGTLWAARTGDAMDRLRRTFPDVRLFHASVATLDQLAPKDLPDVLIVDGEALTPREMASLAILRAHNPWLMTIALLPLQADLLRRASELSHHGVADDVLIEGVEDHPTQIRTIFARGGLRSVARTIEYACAPLPGVFARPNLEAVVEHIAELKDTARFAAALGTTPPELRQVLRLSNLFPPKPLLGRFRILVAARMLQDGRETIERIANELYASGTSLRNAFHGILGIAPSEVRERGALRFAGQLFRVQVLAYRRGVPG